MLRNRMRLEENQTIITFLPPAQSLIETIMLTQILGDSGLPL